MSGSAQWQAAPASIYRRVVAINTVLLVAAALGLALSPATVSQHVTVEEWIVLACGTAFVVLVNVLMLRRVFEPLQRLEGVMRGVDPLEPGRRAAPERLGGHEVGQVAAALNDMLERLEAERADSGRRALEAQESERRRVARELHDEVGQMLTGVVLQLDGLTRRVGPELRDDVLQLQETAREGVEAVREIARGLRPPVLEEFGLRAALVTLATGFTERTGVAVRHDVEGPLPELVPQAELALYRIAQEALTNAARHGDASVVSLELHRHGRALLLRVSDDGRGIDGSAAGRGAGLAGMRERALLVGGRLRIEGAPGRGTTVEVELPLP